MTTDTEKKKGNNISIPIEIVELETNSYHITIPVQINGISGDIIIDTGASVTVIDKNTFSDIELSETPAQMQSASITGEIDNVHIIKNGQFKIGEFVIENMQLAIIELDYVNEMYNKHLNRKIIGLLGCDFCIKYNAVINYKNKTFRFSAKK